MNMSVTVNYDLAMEPNKCKSFLLFSHAEFELKQLPVYCICIHL